MQKPKVDPGEAHRTLLIVWFALLMSQRLFLVLLWFIKPELMRFDLSEPLIDETNFVFVVAVALLSISTLVVSLVWSQRLLNEAIGEQNIYLLQTAMIVGCALSESITLLGLLLAFAIDYQYFFLWFMLGIGSTFLHFPTRKKIDAASYRSIQE
jgi:hypothetical protein